MAQNEAKMVSAPVEAALWSCSITALTVASPTGRKLAFVFGDRAIVLHDNALKAK